MNASRRWTAVVLGAVALALTIVALIDPLEGGLALLAAVIVTLVVRLVSRVPIPRLEIIGMVASVTIAIVTVGLLAIAGNGIDATATVGADAVQAGNPLGGGGIALIWIYRAAVIVAIAGAVQYLVRLVQLVRVAAEAQR
jgi:hypothetical protein